MAVVLRSLQPKQRATNDERRVARCWGLCISVFSRGVSPKARGWDFGPGLLGWLQFGKTRG
jgi:hypothetical protein